jgi:nucleoside phosphorylase
LGEFQDSPSHCLFYRGVRKPVDVVIITAVQVELDAVLRYLHPDGVDAWETIATESDGMWFFCSYTASADPRACTRIAVAKTRTMGLTAASSMAALAIQLFRPTYIVMLGITAGRQGKTEIGDIMIPLEIWDYGAGKWTEDAGKLLFKARGSRHQLEEHIRQRCENLASQNGIFVEMRRRWAERHPGRSIFPAPQVRIAPMVSGAAVVDSEEIWKHVLAQNDEVLALDMEAYGITYAAHNAATPQYGIRCIVAKSVCDYGVVKHDDAQTYAAFTSVLFFKSYLDTFLLGQKDLKSPVRRNMPSAE